MLLPFQLPHGIKRFTIVKSTPDFSNSIILDLSVSFNEVDHSFLLRQFLYLTILIFPQTSLTTLSRPFAGFRSSSQALIVGAVLLVLLCICTHSLGNFITLNGFKYSMEFYIYSSNLDSTPLHFCQIPKSYVQTLIQHFYH